MDFLAYLVQEEIAGRETTQRQRRLKAAFQLVSKACEKVALIITSNLDFSDWGTLFASPATAAALLDRLLHHAHVITLRGNSYRVRNRVLPSKFAQAKDE